MARRGFLVVIEVVIPEKLFGRSNITQSENPRPASHLVNLAVWIAGVIQISGEALAVDDHLAIPDAIEIGSRRTLVNPIGFFGCNPRTVVLYDAHALADWTVREYSNRVNM